MFVVCFFKEKEFKSIRNVKMHEERRDMEASLQRAKREAALADGISWGMDEDAVEENEVSKRTSKFNFK